MAERPVALVTGGGGGIGAASARRLSEHNFVVVTDLDLSAAQRVADEFGGAAYAMDVATVENVEEIVAGIEDQHGPINRMLHTAGVIQERPFPPEDFAQKDFDLVQAVNTRGTWTVNRAVGTGMAKRHRGAIVNIASVAGHRGWPTHSYAASKAAVHSLSRSLAVEWGRSGVRVNSLSPGFTLTPKLKELIQTRNWDSSGPADQSAIGRWVTPEEIAESVEFLLSDRASGITGIDLAVDGGWLAGVNWLAFSGIPGSR